VPAHLPARRSTYKDRYIVDGTFRYDGSSLFGSGNDGRRSARVSGVWRISEEPFFHVPHLSDLRVRASHGTAGNSPQFVAQYETYNCQASGCSLVRPETRCSSLRPPRKRKPGRILLCSTGLASSSRLSTRRRRTRFLPGAHADGLWIQLAVAERRDAREQDIRDRAHSADCDAARFQLELIHVFGLVQVPFMLS